MKRIVSLVASFALMSTVACAGEEAWQDQKAGIAEQSGPLMPAMAPSMIKVPRDGGTGDGGTGDGGSDDCPIAADPPVPTVPLSVDLDTWDLVNTPVLPLTSTTKSLYLVALQSPVDSTRIYAYGIDVAAQKFIFAGTLSKRRVMELTQRAGLDIGRFQISGAADSSSGITIQIEVPAPPPPPPNIHDPSVENYAILAWHVAVLNHQAASQLHQ